MAGTIPGIVESHRVELVGYHDLGGRPGFKMAMHQAGGRWFLYLTHVWECGWTVLDVTEPATIRQLGFIQGPAHTASSQVQVADGKMIVSLEKPLEDFWGPSTGDSETGILIWDVATDPARPAQLATYTTGGTGTHRNYYAGGRYVFLSAQLDGYIGNCLVVVDIGDPGPPREVSRWAWPGQHVAAGETPDYDRFYFHGPAYAVGDRAYLSYGPVGVVILDISEITRPRLVGRLSFGDIGSVLGCHSAIPIVDRRLLVVNSEAIAEGRDEPLNYAVVADIGDEAKPRVVGWLPMPRPQPGLAYTTYHSKGGRFGPHNQAHHQDQAVYTRLHNKVVLTYFNAGLRIYDISDPFDPVEEAWFVPEDPVQRRGPLPKSALVTQFEDVVVDARGYIYCTDKNHGLFVLRFQGELI